MTIMYFVYAYGFGKLIEKRVTSVEFNGIRARVTDENGFTFEIDIDDIIRIDTVE